MKIFANVLDHAVELTVSAVVEEGGTLALSGARLAVKLITSLLTDNKSIEIVRLTRSKTLLAVEGTGFRFVSKLIDGTYPDYRQLIPKPSSCFAIVDRRELARARPHRRGGRPESEAMRLVGLPRSDGEPALHLCIPGWPDLADDALDAEVVSTGTVAVQILHLAEIVAESEGERIHIDTNGNGGPVLVTDPDDPDVLMLQMPCAWPFEDATWA